MNPWFSLLRLHGNNPYCVIIHIVMKNKNEFWSMNL